jgi:hypothetical protein
VSARLSPFVWAQIADEARLSVDEMMKLPLAHFAARLVSVKRNEAWR